MLNGLYMREAYMHHMHVHSPLAKGWSAQVHDYWLHGMLLGTSILHAKVEDQKMSGAE